MMAGMSNEITGLLHEVDQYLQATRMKETTFGRLAVNDGKCIGRLRRGGRAWPETVSRIRMFIASHPANRESNGKGEAA
jgi:hypothetical protein